MWLQRCVDPVLTGGAWKRADFWMKWSVWSVAEAAASIVHKQVTLSLHHRFYLQLEGLFFTGHLHSSPVLTVLQLKVALRWKPLNIQTVPFSIFTQKCTSLWHNSQNNYDNSAWKVRLGKFLFIVLKIRHQLLTDVWFATLNLHAEKVCS